VPVNGVAAFQVEDGLDGDLGVVDTFLDPGDGRRP
jgi:hypothetical protein